MPATPDADNTTTGPEAAVATGTPPATQTRTERPSADRLPPYRVRLHNDDSVHMLTVVRAIVDVVRLPTERATRIMLQAHTEGVATVVVTHRERAELYAELLAGRSLTATIEPAE